MLVNIRMIDNWVRREGCELVFHEHGEEAEVRALLKARRKELKTHLAENKDRYVVKISRPGDWWYENNLPLQWDEAAE